MVACCCNTWCANDAKSIKICGDQQQIQSKPVCTQRFRPLLKRLMQNFRSYIRKTYFSSLSKIKTQQRPVSCTSVSSFFNAAICERCSRVWDLSYQRKQADTNTRSAVLARDCETWPMYSSTAPQLCSH